MTALRDGGGAIVLFVLNVGGAEQKVVIKGFDPGVALRVAVWNEGGKGMLAIDRPVRADGEGRVGISVGSNGLVRVGG